MRVRPSLPDHIPGPLEAEVLDRLAHDSLDRLPVGALAIPVRDEPVSGADAETVDATTRDLPTEANSPAGRRLVALARKTAYPPRRAPLIVTVAIAFARALDSRPGLVEGLRTGAARLVLDVPDPLMLSVLRSVWSTVVYGEGAVIEPITQALHPRDAGAANALLLAVTTVPKAREREEQEHALLRLLHVPRPIVMLSPDADGVLPAVVLRAAEHRLRLPPLDATILASTIHLVTGRAPRPRDLRAAAGLRLTLADIAIAVRADRNPAACLAELTRITVTVAAPTGLGRDLALDQLYGAKEVVTWAHTMMIDLEAWRAGGPWAHVPNGLLLAGPPGCGKTLAASLIAKAADMPLITGSLARWQAADQAHLGTTLRAMRSTFDEARSLAMSGPGGRRGVLLLVDEIDSFVDRSTVRHDHRDYVVEVVNCLLELCDGAVSREGVIVVGTTNDAGRVEPALLRPGRLGHTVTIGYPDLDERRAVLRVRLGGDLADVDLTPVARLTERATGAAIEQLVADARRRARAADLPLALADLLAVADAGSADLPPALVWRTALHEAGHATVAARTIGTAGLIVALQSRDGAGGWLDLTGLERTAGTRAQVEAMLRVLLAGRAAEVVALGEPSAGARADLEAATRLCARLVSSWGLAGDLVSLGENEPTLLLADPRLRRDAGAILERLHEEACALLQREHDGLLRLAERLRSERRLDGDEIAAILGPPPRDETSSAVGVWEDKVSASDELSTPFDGRRP